MAVTDEESSAWRGVSTGGCGRQTDNDGADMTCCGSLFQTQAAVTEKVRSSIVDSHVQRAISNGDEAECRRHLSSRSASWLRSSTLIDKESELEINSLPCLQPVQLAKEWTDMVNHLDITECQKRTSKRTSQKISHCLRPIMYQKNNSRMHIHTRLLKQFTC